MVLQSRHQQSLALRNLDSDSLRNLDSVIETVDVRCVMLCVETGEVVSSSAIMALADGLSVPVHLDIALSRDWHKPVTYRDYLRSPQRGLWRTAMELRMDAYKAIPLYVLVSVDSVISQGFTIINTLWAFRHQVYRIRNI